MGSRGIRATTGQILTAWIFILVIPMAGWGQKAVPGIQTTPGSGVEIALFEYFSETPLYSSVPLQVHIQNDSGRDRTWSLLASVRTEQREDSGKSRSDWEFPVPDGEKKVFEIMVPVLPPPGSLQKFSRELSLVLSLSGYGIRGEARLSSTSVKSENPPLAMSETIGASSWGLLEQHFKKSGGPHALLGGQFDPMFLPSDWRGYTGYHSIWMASEDWLKADPSSKNALSDWVAQGGHLYIACADREAQVVRSLKLPGGGNAEKWSHGLGTIRIVPWDEEGIDVEEVAIEIRENRGYFHQDLSELYSGWTLVDALEPIEIRPGFILMFVILFAILVGPINLFVFCRKGKQVRLFWTTPALSVGASLLLALLIVLDDGFGGVGQRVTTVVLLSEEKQSVVIQEQVCRTGVLLDRGFEVEEPLLISPIPLTQQGSVQCREVSSVASQHHGDWFSSRAIQAQYAQTLRPTRARLQVFQGAGQGSDPPTVLSSIDAHLDTLFILDEEHEVWRADSVRVGTKTQLVQCSFNDFKGWRASLEIGGRTRTVIDLHLESGSPIFIAFSKGPNKDAIALFEGLDWNQAGTFYMGEWRFESETPRIDL